MSYLYVNRDWCNGARGSFLSPNKKPKAAAPPRKVEGPEDWARQLRALGGNDDYFSKKERARLQRLLERGY